MKLFRRLGWYICLAIVFTMLLPVSVFAAKAKPAQPVIDRPYVTMNVGQKTGTRNGIVLTVKNAKKVTSWFTDDPTVANAVQCGPNQCRVYGIGYGTATITVRADNRILSSRITVRDPNPGLKVSMPFSGYKKLTRAARGRVVDVLAIAESQRGYRGIDRGSYKASYFGSKWDTYNINRHDRDLNGAWCSDFISWCLFAARVPNTMGLFDIKNSYCPERTITKFYGNKWNSLYRYRSSSLSHPNTVSSLLSGCQVRGTLDSKTIMPGDIAIVSAGHHTTIVKHVNRSNGAVQVVEGNCSNMVMTSRWISASEVYAVARPAYNN